MTTTVAPAPNYATMTTMRVLKLACLVALVALAAACADQEASRPSTNVVLTSASMVATGSSKPSPPADALVWCSGTKTMNVSFAGMQIRYGHFSSKGFLLDVVYHGRSVFKSVSFLGFPAPISAPVTTGDTCIAKMAGYHAPVVLVYAVAGACCASFLQVVYPTSGERYVTTVFDVASEFDIRVLGGSLALIVGDLRFDFLFTDGAGSITPVRVMRFEGGHLVDVSTKFPQVIAADASSLSQSTKQQWYRTDGVFGFIGELEAWVADECRLGKAPQAWRTAEQQVARGRYRHWMARNEPHYIQQLKADLVRWGYCPSAE